MKVQRPSIRLAAVAASLVVVVGVTAPAANADLDTNMDGGEAISVIEELAPATDLVPTEEITQNGDTLIVDGGDLKISADATAGTDLQLPEGLEINIAPIADRGHGEGELVDGQAVTPVGEDQTVVTQATEGGARMIGILETAEASTAVDYSIDLPKGVTLVPEDDGGMAITQQGPAQTFADGTKVIETFAVGELEAPWAVDADGNSVPTHFVYDETTGVLTQVVSPTPDTVFPVAADPSWKVTKVGPVPTGVKVWFTWTESVAVANSGTPTAIRIAAMSGNPYVVAAVAAVAIGAQVAANVATSSGRCLMVNWNPVVTGWDTYGANRVCKAGN